MGSGLVLALLGGALIGAAALGLLFTNGHHAGISGILTGALYPRRDRAEWPWQMAFLLGLFAAGLTGRFAAPGLFTEEVTSPVVLAVAGVLVGFGTRVSRGCTSGHGICGVGSRSLRSIAATCTFMALGAATVFVVRHALGVLP